MATSGAFQQQQYAKPFYVPSMTEDVKYLLDHQYISRATALDNGYYVLTRAGACLTALGHRCHRLGSITSFIRSKLSLKELSTFELFLKLQSHGWRCCMSTPKAQCLPFQIGGEKVFYVQGTMLRPYLLVLLDHEALLAKSEGFRMIHHHQLKAYYDAILSLGECSPGTLPLVFPGRPASYYKDLLGDHNKKKRKRRESQQELSDGFEDESGRFCILEKEKIVLYQTIRLYLD